MKYRVEIFHSQSKQGYVAQVFDDRAGCCYSSRGVNDMPHAFDKAMAYIRRLDRNTQGNEP